MSLELCILASGSAGNCAALRTPGGVMLIDAGIGPRTASRRLEGTGISIADVSAICLTHLDRDHFSPTWLRTIRKQGIRVFCHEHRVREVLAADTEPRVLRPLVQCFDGVAFHPLPHLSFRPIPFAHDQAGSHGFLIEGFGRRIGYATDLGRVPDELLRLFCDADILALESNYDPDMQLASSRPAFLKQRIMGGSGHLSNAQALAAIRRILDRCEDGGRRLPAHIVLLHRSRECNCPRLLRRLFDSDPRIAPRLTLAEQYQRTEWLRPRPMPAIKGEQLALFAST